MNKRTRESTSRIIGALLMGLLLVPAVLIAQTRVEPGFNLFSVEQDVEIGRQSAVEVEQELPVLEDRSVTGYVREVGERLAAATPHAEFPYTFEVLNLDDVNAFALPGGPIYINRGLIEAVNDEDELAGVMAHEIAHIDLRHGTAQASKAYLANAGLGVLGSLLGEGSSGDIIGAVGGFGLNTLFLSFSREAEEEADIVGAQILARAGYDPLSMIDMFSSLQAMQARDPNALEQFFSSHPPYEERQAAVRDEAHLLSVAPQRSVGGLAAVQRELRDMPPAPTMEQVLGGNVGDATAEERRDTEERDVDVDRPVGDLRTFEHSQGYFSLRFPEDWSVLPSNDFSVTIAPQHGIVEEGGRREIVYGVIVDHHDLSASGGVRDRTWLRSFSQTLELDRVDAPRDLEMAALEVIDRLRQSNPHLELERRAAETRLVDRQPAVVVWLSGYNPTTRTNELVALATRETGDDHVIYMVMIAPEHRYRTFEPTFERMLSSLQVNDRVAHRR